MGTLENLRRIMKQIPLILAMSLCLRRRGEGESAPDMQAAVNFDSAMLWGGANGADLSRFNYSNALRPQLHRRHLRQQLSADPAAGSIRRGADVRAGLEDGAGGGVFTYGQLEAMQVRLRALDPAWSPTSNPAGAARCWAKLFPDSRESFDFGENRLEVSIPQAYTINRFRRDISPDEWDSGITAFRLGYQYNYADYIGGLRGAAAGPEPLQRVQLQGWYLRNSSTLGWGQGRFTRRSQRTSRRRISRPGGRAWCSATCSPAAKYFAPYSMRGMLVGRYRHAAVLGAAVPADHTRRCAHPGQRQGVSSRCAGFQDAVPPGPFAIDDYSPASYGGDLRVVVTEANGAVRRSPCRTPARCALILPGQTQWSFSAGRYRNYRNDGQDRPWVTQLTGRHGVPTASTCTAAC